MYSYTLLISEIITPHTLCEQLVMRLLTCVVLMFPEVCVYASVVGSGGGRVAFLQGHPARRPQRATELSWWASTHLDQRNVYVKVCVCVFDGCTSSHNFAHVCECMRVILVNLCLLFCTLIDLIIGDCIDNYNSSLLILFITCGDCIISMDYLWVQENNMHKIIHTHTHTHTHKHTRNLCVKTHECCVCASMALCW